MRPGMRHEVVLAHAECKIFCKLVFCRRAVTMPRKGFTEEQIVFVILTRILIKLEC